MSDAGLAWDVSYSSPSSLLHTAGRKTQVHHGMLDAGCSVKTFYSRGGKVAERVEIDDSGERKQLMIAEIFVLHVQGEGKANLFFAHKSLPKSHLQRQCRNTIIFLQNSSACAHLVR
jgi:hypothetical protein